LKKSVKQHDQLVTGITFNKIQKISKEYILFLPLDDHNEQ